MLKKITIPPVPIIIVGRAKTDESEIISFDYNLYYNNEKRQKVKYPQNTIKFSKKIGKTQYDVLTYFDTKSKLSVLNQFKSLILKNDLI